MDTKRVTYFLPRFVPSLILTLALCVPCLATAQSAPYVLVAGDTVSIDYIGSNTRLDLQIDFNGQLRLPDVGAVTIAGLTLDAAEAQLEHSFTEARMLVNARTSLSLVGYAPIIVTGDVSGPGRFDYLPGTTVASALGLAGGSRIAGISALDISQANADLQARLRLVNLEIAALVARIARLEATLSQGAEVTLSAQARAQIPSPESVRLEEITASEQAILANARAQTQELMTSWDGEIAALIEQRQLLEQRIDAQEMIVENAAEALETARTLNERGLQTSARLAAAEQGLAAARSRVFELEALRINLVTSTSRAVRDRAQYLRRIQEETLIGLNGARIDLDNARLRYGQASEKLALISSGDIAALLDTNVVNVSYTIISPREGRPGDMQIDAQTALLPGDTLIVDVEFGGNATVPPPNRAEPQ